VTEGHPVLQAPEARDSAKLVDLPPEEPVGSILNYETRAGSHKGLLRSGALVSAVALLTNGFNVIFHFATARFMGPAEYSLLTTMFAVFIVAAVPLIALQATLTRELSTLLQRDDAVGAGLVLRSAFRSVFRAALFGVIAAVVLFIPLMSVLGVDRPLPVVAVSVAFLAQVPGTLAAGALVATDRFTTLSWTQSLQVTIKLVTGVGLAAIGLGASAVTFGVAVASAVGFVTMLLALRGLVAPAKGLPLPKTRLFGRYSMGAALALGLHTVLVNTDLIWGRARLSADDAGLYAAASVATSVILLVPIGVNTVLFPRVARLNDASQARRHLLLAAGFVAVACGAGVVILAVFAEELLHAAFGGQYDGAAHLLGGLGIAMAVYAVSIVYLNHLLALGRPGVAGILFVAAGVQQLGFLLFAHSADAIVHVQLACAVALVLALHVYQARVRMPVLSASAAVAEGRA
jgi:O-antigen/teichoic acid export membrane protein